MPRSLSERLAALERTVRHTSGPATNAGLAEGCEDSSAKDNEANSVRDKAQESRLTRMLSGLQQLGFASFAEHGYFVRVLRYDSLTLHGVRRFADVLEVDLHRLTHATKLAGLPKHLVFYDTETTGLGTGAGTFPFLHAIGQFEDDEFLVYQYFLTDYGAEGMMLERIRDDHFSLPDTAVVSFNGKSFDWPLFKNRLVLHRRTLLTEPHQLDLLHPSRRLWKKSLERVNLTTLESHVLGLIRTDDLPGKEAPARYFAYLDERRHQLVEPVFEHNAADVCSLASLTTVIADTLNGELSVARASEYIALGRWFDEWREHEQAERCLVAATLCVDADWLAFWLYSLHHKRFGDWQKAVETWKEMGVRYSWSVLPFVELAKYAEHRERDYAQAEVLTCEAIKRVKQAQRIPGGEDKNVLAALRHRLERIRRKSARDAQVR